MGIIGYIYARNVSESLNFVGYLIVYFCATDSKTKGISLSYWDFLSFIEYFWISLKFVFAIYTEYLALEMNTVYVGMLSNTLDLTAWVLLFNIIEMVYFMGTGVSNVLRTRLNTFFGMGEHETAKIFFWWFIKFNAVSGVIIGSVLILGRY